MNDNDVMGTAYPVALRFQNAKVDGARKLLQKMLIILFTSSDSDAPYGTNFYANLKRASASDVERINGLLNTALSDVRSYMVAYAQDGDPAIDNIYATVTSISGTVAEATIGLELTDGTTASTSIQLGDSTQ